MKPLAARKDLPLQKGQSDNSAEIEAQFATELERLAGISIAKMGICVVAVSGGPDSMALLALANTVPNLTIIAATVDHQLRSESHTEAAMVAQFCAQHDIDHAILLPEEPITGNVQSRARDCRYALLQQCAQAKGAQCILTAHHADDQLETLIMRLNRGSGVAGMAAIRAVHKGDGDVAIMRPCLPFTKEQLVDYVTAQKIPFITDPSNENRAFDRVQIRQALASCDWLDPIAANRTAQALDNANMALVWAGEHFAKSHLKCANDHAAINPDDLPEEILLRLVFLALQHLRPDYQPRGSALNRVVQSLKSRKKTMQGDILCSIKGDIWYFAPAPPRKLS